jgi:hypothetical protein
MQDETRASLPIMAEARERFMDSSPSYDPNSVVISLA